MIRPRTGGVTVAPCAMAPYEDAGVRRATGDAVRPGGTRLTDRALALAALPPGALVVDLGCGAGTSVRHLARRHGLRGCGIDPSATLTAAARHRDEGLPVLRGRAERLPLADRSVDAVLAECVLSVVADPDVALAEIARVLRPGGRLLLTDLYARAEATDDFPVGSCLRGARSRTELLTRVRRHGLHLLRWEDHSDELSRLAVRLVWETGSADQLWCAGTDTTPQDLRAALRRVRPGYFLLLADLPRR